MARQDSGTLERFASVYKGFPVMASEIETFADIQAALDLGYSAFGAGGEKSEARTKRYEFVAWFVGPSVRM